MDAQTSILGNIGFYSYGMASLAYIMVMILAFIIRRNSPLGTALLAATAFTALWASAVTVSTLLWEPQVRLIQLTEILRTASWIFVLLTLLGTRLQGTNHILATDRWVPWFATAILLVLAAVFGVEPLVEQLSPAFDISLYANFSAWLAMSIVGLLLLEQFFRNSNEDELWATKHMCVGLGILFAFDFFMYAEALLFRHLDQALWQARGFVSTMAAALMAISIARTDRSEPSDNDHGVSLSRHVAFHSLTLMASGIYLITMALAAYFIRYLGGSWSGVLQIAFLCAAGLTLIVLLFSGQIRARSRVWLSKNFFSYKYDYRLEWLQFTRTLAGGDNDIPQNIIRAVSKLAKSPSGVLWSLTDNGRFNILANWEMPLPESDLDLGNLAHWLQAHGWIIDLREWRRAPDVYRNLQLPALLTEIPRAWLVIPLLFGDRLQGILLLRESELVQDLNWEDRDLLKLAGRQAASHLAQFQSDKALVDSRQFEAFNRLSAYVIHDLKNILAQLSLVVSNAQKHKENPEFIDDMVNTVSNSVTRMSKLMAQLRSGAGQTELQQFDLDELLESVVADCKLRMPVPEFSQVDGDYSLRGDYERLQTVFSHLIQNAQEATEKEGRVSVRLMNSPGCAIVEIEDTGTGMDAHFVRHRLFKPFDSTKGLTGMGIGAFESRDFIRRLGGDISVSSTPGQGSLFRLSVPTENTTKVKHESGQQEVNNR
ncbi:MAG: PEP-CTERM system histidine kinase PrsK [Halioglobus sp.]|nr:PEP-CTERM system histidine kinase PrsK [Halioglobus sp.]